MGRRGGPAVTKSLFVRGWVGPALGLQSRDSGQRNQSLHTSKGKGNADFRGKSPHVEMLADIFLQPSLAEGQSHTHAASLLNKSSLRLAGSRHTRGLWCPHASVRDTHRARGPKSPHQPGLQCFPKAERKIVPSSGRTPVRAEASTPRGVSVCGEPYAILYSGPTASSPGLL